MKPETIFDLYQKFSPVGIAAKFFNDRKVAKQKSQDDIVAKAASKKKELLKKQKQQH